ncbi:MAG: hypothetical protein U5N58_04340 [Actinomycetota bacterium]|nr:hypothetical protein [Actinomycetota bacterium]
MEQEKKDHKNLGASFGEMMKEFGEAVSKVFNDPELKKKASEFSESASRSARAFGDRFKDEEVKEKFREAGKAAKKFGDDVAEIFKEEQDSDTKQEENSSKDVVPTVEKKNYKQEENRGSRLTGYSMSIAWGIVFLVFFNFFYHYIAYYEYNSALQTWARYPVLTDDFRFWLPIFTVAVVVSIIGNIVMIIIDHWSVRQITNIVMNIFGIASVSTLLSIFPFDFSNIPAENIASILIPIVTVALVLVIIGLSIATVVSFVKLIVFTIKKEI